MNIVYFRYRSNIGMDNVSEFACLSFFMGFLLYYRRLVATIGIKSGTIEFCTYYCNELTID
jgi:hypothetical protein